MFKVLIAFCALDGSDCEIRSLPIKFPTEFECSTYKLDYVNSGKADPKARELNRLNITAICLSEKEMDEMGLKVITEERKPNGKTG